MALSSPVAPRYVIGLLHYVSHQLLCQKQLDALCLRRKWQGALHSRLGLIKENSRARWAEMSGGLPATTVLPYFTHCWCFSISFDRLMLQISPLATCINNTKWLQISVRGDVIGCQYGDTDLSPQMVCLHSRLG